MPKAGAPTKNLPKRKGTGKKRTSVVMPSSEISFQKTIVTLHGPLGSGKSTMGVSVSKYFPKVRPTKKFRGPKSKRINLKDVFVIGIDNGAMDCLYDLGIDVDTFDINLFMAREELWGDVAGFREPPDIIETMEYAQNEAITQVYKHGKKWIVVDTPSMMDRKLNSFWEENCPTTSSGKLDTRAMYGNIYKSHRQLHENLVTLDCGLVYCCHSKAYNDDLSPEQKKAKTVTVVAGMPDIVPDITGKGALMYKADASIEMCLFPSQKPGGKLEFKAYSVRQDEVRNSEVKNRFGLSIPPVTDCHLGKILEGCRG